MSLQISMGLSFVLALVLALAFGVVYGGAAHAAQSNAGDLSIKMGRVEAYKYPNANLDPECEHDSFHSSNLPIPTNGLA